MFPPSCGPPSHVLRSQPGLRLETEAKLNEAEAFGDKGADRKVCVDVQTSENIVSLVGILKIVQTVWGHRRVETSADARALPAPQPQKTAQTDRVGACGGHQATME